MNYKEEIFLGGGGLDRDSDKKRIAKGDSDFILNMIPSGDGKHGVLTSIRGNREVDFYNPVSDKRIIGDCYDSKRNCQYIFVKAGVINSIYKYDYATDTVSFLVNQATGLLGFDEDYPIFDACVIGDILFWNPRTSSPRAINVVWAANALAASAYSAGTTYTVGTEVIILGKIVEVVVQKTGSQLRADIVAGNYSYSRDTGKRGYTSLDLYFYNYTAQPLHPVTGTYGTDTAKKYNNLRKNVFQFCYRYVTPDGSRSIVSPYSDAFVQYSSETYSGEVQSNVSADNNLVLSIPYPESDILNYSNVDYIELFFRVSEGSGWGVWRVADIIPWETIITQTVAIGYTFYNDKSYPVADQSELSRSYSSLPALANAQTSLMNNRMAYLGLTEGFDNITPTVTLTATFSQLSVLAPGTSSLNYNLAQTTDSFGYLYKTDVIGAVPTNGYVVVITVDGVEYNYVVNTAVDTSVDQFIDNLIVFIEAIIPGVFKSGRLVTDQLQFHLPSFGGDILPRTVTMIVYTAGANSFYKYKGFKTGAEHAFCIFYYDKLMRRSGAMIADGLKITLPFITEQTITSPERIYRYSIDWSLNHPPPDDAVYWRFGYAGNTTMVYFIQTDITSFSLAGSAPYASFSTIDITSWQDTYKTAYPHANIEPYEFQAGDRIRIITDAPSTTYGVPLDVLYDEEIVDFDSDNNLIVIHPFVSPSEIGSGSIVEVYRPQKAEDVIYYEYGRLYDIYTDTDSVRYHRGSETDQTVSASATGVFTDGDIYHITRYNPQTTSLLYPVESMTASDFYDSEVWGQGRIGLVDNIGKVTINNIRFSDTHIEGTKVNGLSSFQYNNSVSVTNKFGKITGAVEIGHTLRVYLETNGVSIPVGRTEYTDAEGNNTVIVSDSILGTQRIDSEEYGTVHPESICKVGTHVYFFDSRKGCFVRDSLNGSFPISGKFNTEGGSADFKMESYFKEKAAAIRENGESNYKVHTGWDETKKLLVVCFDDQIIGDHDDIVCFHEPSNRWVTFLIRENNAATFSDMPTYFSKAGNFLFSYEGGDVYVHDESADYCKFYGVQYGIECRVYSAEGNNAPKLYEAIEVHSNQQLTLDTVYVYTEETNEGYMQSKIPSSWWKKLEGVYRAPYLRNLLTNGSVANIDLLNGDFLRGYVIENRLTKSSVTTELNLFKVVISSDNSNV